MARMVAGENGLPVAEVLPDMILIGNVSQEKAQKIVAKEHGSNVTVFGVEPSTETYVMDVEEFIKHARLKTDENTDSEE